MYEFLCMNLYLEELDLKMFWVVPLVGSAPSTYASNERKKYEYMIIIVCIYEHNGNK